MWILPVLFLILGARWPTLQRHDRNRTIGNGPIMYATPAGFACQSFQTCSQNQFIPSVSLLAFLSKLSPRIKA